MDVNTLGSGLLGKAVLCRPPPPAFRGGVCRAVAESWVTFVSLAVVQQVGANH